MEHTPDPPYGPLLGRTVFVTGHTGFIGSWLCMLLRQSGVNVTGYSLSEDPSALTRSAWLKKLGIPAAEGDVRDFDGLLAAVEEAKPDVVVHLAAQPILSRGFLAPHLTFDVNINGTLNILEVARRTSLPALLTVTSDKCYSPSACHEGAVTEDGALGGEGPYPASKTIAELLFREFNSLPTGVEQTRMASVRLGNVIGGGDEADRLVPNCLRSFRAGTPFAIRDPGAVRPFQHVLDVVRGMMLLGDALLQRRVPSGIPLNFAPPQAGLSAIELVTALAAAWGPPATISSTRAHVDFPEESVLRIDGSRASQLLGWHHELDIHAAAARTVEWSQLVDQGALPEVATAEQVKQYLECVGNGA